MEDEKFIEFLTGKFGDVEGRFDKAEGRLDKVETEVKSIKNQMVTKAYLDDKIADLEGKLIIKIRKEDEKFTLLVEILLDKKVISKNDVSRIEAIEISPNLK